MCSTKFYECLEEIYSYFVHARLKFVSHAVKRTKVEIFSAEKLTVSNMKLMQLLTLNIFFTARPEAQRCQVTPYVVNVPGVCTDSYIRLQSL